MQERIKKRFSQIVLFKIFKQAKLWLFMLQVLSHDFDTYDLFYGRQAVSLYIFISHRLYSNIMFFSIQNIGYYSFKVDINHRR